ncbi:thiamine pyrophosphate-binding protein [Paenibacillus sp. P96]|uniref:Thiamine pyrophosphate-binding protein n=1 Tax=Paenibacillus zeirhizosphaerae TaxID=2987519 RepID=A0ABT9FXB0_9BACL|nr:thiamine pyrophosphate-binding protein [Paenibacillus sp. P96]MDP4099363.1 thiamine pyrophosphate-binding protein [Paenibacillus sp. P96]
MKLSDYVIDFISRQGVKHIFEMTGSAIVHLIDSTMDADDIQTVSMHHEQAAAFAAEGYGRINGKLGVAMATRGPGALNLLTGIGSCYFDSVPTLFITGQVNTYEYKFDRPVRQIGFQETDIVSIVKPITKFAKLLIDEKKIRYELEKAVFLARHGRPGPVLLDLPMNVQRAEIEPDELESFFGSEEHLQYEDYASAGEIPELEEVLGLLAEAKRPLVLVGGGVRVGNATSELREFVDKSAIPVVSSLLGLDALPSSHPLSVGLIGSYGNRYSNLAVATCDLLLILGSRLDTRQTGTKPATFARGARKVHVDIDPTELNAKVRADVVIHADVKLFLQEMNKQVPQAPKRKYAAWRRTIEDYMLRYPSGVRPMKPGIIDPNQFVQLLSVCCEEKDLIVLDVGQHQMWASQSFQLKQGQRLLNAGGMGAMGFALPAGIGAALCEPDSRVVVIVGDGGFQVNIQELHTIVQNRLPLKIFVMNNHHLGMVRQFQDMALDGRRQSTVEGYGCPDLMKVSEAYGIPARRIMRFEEAKDIISEALELPGPYLVEVNLETDTEVHPKLAVNRPIEDMYPFLDRSELRALMKIKLESKE